MGTRTAQIICIALIVLTTLGIFIHPTQAQVLIIQSSDQHSSYKGIEKFLRSFSALRQNFLHEHPRGKVVVVLNGDLIGLSSFSEDHGELLLEMIVALSKLEHVEVIYTPGNHEEFDWQGGSANKLHLEHAQYLAQNIKGGFHKTVANIVPTRAYAPYIKPYHDVRTGNGKVLRVVGLVLNDFFQRSYYDRLAQPQLIADVRDSYEVAQEEIRRARRDGVRSVIFAHHEGFEPVMRLHKELSQWQSPSRRLREVKIPMVFAAHDHHRREQHFKSFWLVDSGSFFDFSVTYLDKDLHARSVRMFDRDDPHYTHADLEPMLVPIVDKLNAVLEARERSNRDILAMTPAFEGERRNMRSGRTLLGTLIPDAMRAEWKSLPETALAGTEPGTVGLFDSTSFRRSDPIQQGPLTRGVLRSFFYPFGVIFYYRISGRDLKQVVKHLHDASYNEYLVQMSSTLRMRKQSGSSEFALLHRASPDEAWVEVSETKTYALALDKWLAYNGHQIKGWESTLGNAQLMGEADLLEVMEKRLSPLLTGCEKRSASIAN